MKKLIILLIIALSSYMLWGTISDIALSISSQNTIAGSEINVPIVTGSLNGNGVISYELDISYDATRLSFICAVKTGTISAPGMVNANAVGGVVHIGAIFAQPLSGQGTLLLLKFQAVQPGTAALGFTSAMMNTTALQYLSGGVVNIDAQPVNAGIAVADYLSPVGTAISIPVTSTGVAAVNCTSFQFKLYYDPAVISFIGLDTNGCISTGWSFSSRNIDGVLQVAAIGTTPLALDGNLIKLNFQILPTAVTFSALTIQNALFNALAPISVTNGRLDVYNLSNLSFAGITDITHIIDSNVLCAWDVLNTAVTNAEIRFEAGTDADWSVAELYSSGWQTGYSTQPLGNLVPGSDLNVRVQMRIGTLLSEWITLSGHLNMLPACPQLTSPADNVIWKLATLEYQCTEAIDTDGDVISYIFEQLINGVTTQTSVTTPWLSVPAADNQAISWRVMITDGYQSSVWSPSWSVSVNNLNQPPYAIDPSWSLSFPEDSSYDLDLLTLFSDPDLSVGDHLRYYGTGSTHIAVTFVQNLATLHPQANWFGSESVVFRVRDDSLATAIDTVMITITNTPDPPLAAVAYYPTADQWNVMLNPVISWTAGSGDAPSGYRLWFGTNNPPTNLVNGMDLGLVTSWQPTGELTVNTYYYWQIVPYNADGAALDCPVWSFRTIAANVIYQFPYLKNFEDNVLLSGNWTNVNQGITAGNWRMNPSSGVGASKCATVGRSTGTYWFISPAIACPTQGSVLSFSIRDYSASPTYDLTGEYLYIMISTTGSAVGDFTTTIGTITNQMTTTTHTTYSYDLQQFAGQVIYIAYKRVAINGNFLYVDNIQIANSVPVLSVAAGETHLPAAVINHSSSTTVNLSNTGTGILTGSAVYSAGFSGTTVFTARNPVLTVNYYPTAFGMNTGTVQITSNGGNYTVNLKANAGWNVHTCDYIETNGFAYHPTEQAWILNTTQKNSGLAALTPVNVSSALLTPWISVSGEAAIGFWAKAVTGGTVYLDVNAGTTRSIAGYQLFTTQAVTNSWQYYQLSLAAYAGQVISLALRADPTTSIDDLNLLTYQIPAIPQVVLTQTDIDKTLEWQPIPHSTGYRIYRSYDLTTWDCVSPITYESTSWQMEDTETAVFYKVLSENGLME